MTDLSDPRGPGGGQGGWFKIANAHWLDWSRAYGDTCPAFQEAVGELNRSRSVEGLRRGLPPLEIGDPLPAEWWSTAGWKMWGEFLSSRNRRWKAKCEAQGIQEPDASPAHGSERFKKLVAGGDRLDPRVPKLEALAKAATKDPDSAVKAQDATQVSVEPDGDSWWPWLF